MGPARSLGTRTSRGGGRVPHQASELARVRGDVRSVRATPPNSPWPPLPGDRTDSLQTREAEWFWRGEDPNGRCPSGRRHPRKQPSSLTAR